MENKSDASSSIRANRADFLKKLAAVPNDVRYTYHRWRQRIVRAARRRAKPGKRASVVLYSQFGVETLPHRIRQVVDLLNHSAQDWGVQTEKTEFRMRVIFTVR